MNTCLGQQVVRGRAIEWVKVRQMVFQECISVSGKGECERP
jgi:hypothetical protein